MPWCPECKSEYREGITTCVDCGCELVDDLSLISDENNYEEVPLELLEATEDFVLELDEEEKEEIAEALNDSHVYINNEEKAEENRTSAYTLLSIGGLGIVAVILYFFDVININVSSSGKYMITGVMGTLFILFFVMGVVSLRNFKILKKRAYKENNLTQEIKKWCVTSFDKEYIDSNIGFKDTAEELKFFERAKYLKNAINKQFMNLDDAYVNRLIDEIYPDIFEK